MHPASQPELRVDPVTFLDANLPIRFGFEGAEPGDNFEPTSRTGSVLTTGARDREPRPPHGFEEGHFAGLDLESPVRGKKTDFTSHGPGV